VSQEEVTQEEVTGRSDQEEVTDGKFTTPSRERLKTAFLIKYRHRPIDSVSHVSKFVLGSPLDILVKPMFT
jgi:hypothetical protein